MDFTRIGLDGENGAKGIVQGISLNMIGWSGTQWVRTGAEMNADFKASNDFLVESVKFHRVPFQVSWVNRIMMSE